MTSHAEKCPVCDATGMLPGKPSHTDPLGQHDVQCHGCGGTGWVTVIDPMELDSIVLKPFNPVVVAFHATQALAEIKT